MTTFYKTAGLTYDLDGGYIEPTNQFNVTISSTYEESRFPDEKRKIISLTLTKNELLDLINGLVDIVDSES